MDLLASIPFFAIFTSLFKMDPTVPKKGYNWAYLVYILKTLRFYKAYRITTPRFVSDLIKNSYEQQRLAFIADEIKAREEKDESSLRYLRDPKIDRVQLARQVIIVYVFKIVRMLLGILFLSFMLGSFWYIFTQAIWMNQGHVAQVYSESDFFVDLYDLEN